MNFLKCVTECFKKYDRPILISVDYTENVKKTQKSELEIDFYSLWHLVGDRSETQGFKTWQLPS